MGKIESSFKVGQLVTSIEYPNGYEFAPIGFTPDLFLFFEGIGIIVDISWPDQAKVYTNKGELICLKTENLKIAKLKKAI
tara:strand:+ start:9767 stop:10006 length:240 start_codon:yes stop_codon:yes gene_type:complete